MLRRITHCFSLLLLLTSLSAQNNKKEQKKINQYCQQAEKALLKFQSKKAIHLYQKALLLNPDFPPAHRGIGAAYQLMGQPDSAAMHYEIATQVNPDFSRVIYYDIGLSHYRSGKYDDAVFFFELFETLQQKPTSDFGINGAYEKDLEQQLLTHLEDDLKACYYARDSVPFMQIASIKNLGDSINTAGGEYFPYLTNQQDLLFYTSLPSPTRDENLKVSQWQDSLWRKGDFVAGTFNTHQNEGMSTMTRDGRQLFFTACGQQFIKGSCDILLARTEKDSIQSIRTLDGSSNTVYWESQASISCDGTQLYFASDRPGGFGGSDIWVSYLQDDGQWSEAQNLGPVINTANHEEAPFISIDGSMLFFSSLGHLGFGEQDVFASRKNETGNWQRPLNLGTPVNTAFREIGFFLSADGKTGYISSERPGGYGRMDIYHFELSEVLSSTPVTLVEGFVRDSISGQPVSALLQIKGRDNIRSDEAGRFFVCLPANEFFDFEISEKGYHRYTKTQLIPPWENKEYYPMEILLQKPNSTITEPPPTLIRNQTVYFDFDKSDLTALAIDSLDQYVQNLKAHGYHKVSVLGYCDFKGSVEYNQLLSEKRAHIVGDYIKSKGISVTSIKIEGRGEVNDSKERHLNRRVEMKTDL